MADGPYYGCCAAGLGRKLQEELPREIKTKPPIRANATFCTSSSSSLELVESHVDILQTSWAFAICLSLSGWRSMNLAVLLISSIYRVSRYSETGCEECLGIIVVVVRLLWFCGSGHCGVTLEQCYTPGRGTLENVPPKGQNLENEIECQLPWSKESTTLPRCVGTIGEWWSRKVLNKF